MKKYIYTVGTAALALAMSGVPTALVHAQDATTGASATVEVTSISDDSIKAMAEVRTDATTGSRTIDPRVLMEQKRELLKKQAEQARELKQERRAELASSTDGVALSEQERELLKKRAEQLREQAKQQREQVREESKQQFEQAREVFKDRIEFMRENATTSARSLEQLKQLIEERRMEIKDEVASTTPDVRKILKDATSMRVAVHALLASRDLLGGGIGQQVSEIAKHMNDSVASTTNAEAMVQSRGFFSKLLFGGDKKSAEVITKQVEQNEARLQTLTELLASASTTEEVKATLDAQVQAMQTEQGRLQSVAEKQSKLWGLFSWRF